MTRTSARILLPLSLTLAACSSDTTLGEEPALEEMVTIDAGIAGTVQWVEYGADDGIEDSGPVAGATITVSLDQDPPQEVATAVTDDDGFFELSLEDGAYLIRRAASESESESESTSVVVEGNVIGCRNFTNPGLGPEWECSAL